MIWAIRNEEEKILTSRRAKVLKSHNDFLEDISNKSAFDPIFIINII